MNRFLHTRQDRSRGFSLVEMLVVLAIILLLVGLLLTAMGPARCKAREVATGNYIDAMQMGMNGYLQAHDRYIPSDYRVFSGVPGRSFGVLNTTLALRWTGGEILTQALIGPQAENIDGIAGPGWEFQEGQQGPYLENPEKHLRRLAIAGNDRWVMISPAVAEPPSPILYYRANRAGDMGDIGSATSLWSSTGRFDLDHNSLLTGTADPRTWLNSLTAQQRKQRSYTFKSAQYLIVGTGCSGEYGDQDNVIRLGK